MADIELVIKIPNRIYKINQDRTLNITDTEILEKAVRNGTPLPKGHGKLIDVSEYFKKEFGDAREFLDKATTIIEADGGDAE